MATNENLIPIPGRLHSLASEGHVVGADEVYDDTLERLQSDINADVKVMGASGENHSKGLVPDPGATAGTSKFLREDGTWQEVNASPEVQIGGTAPTSESEIKLFVDEDSDDTVEVYTKAQANILYAGKTDKVSGATNGNFAGLDANGNLVDSGKKASDFQLKIIDGASIGSGYGTCSTAATTAAKTATLANYLLLKNIPVSIFFESGVNVANATLNINSQGAKPIFIGRAALQPGVIRPRTTVTFVYDGTHYDIISIGGLEQSGSDSDLWVDMGLPSGLKWAKRNIDITQANGFAASEYQYECTFFSWGNTNGQNPADSSSFAETWGSSVSTEPYVSSQGAALTGNSGLGYDAARANLGAPWRMPIREDFIELFANIIFIDGSGTEITDTNKITTLNGISGIYLQSIANGNRLFFPCSGYGGGQLWSERGTGGYYWTSSYLSDIDSYNMGFYTGVVQSDRNIPRHWGLPVRPVQ